MKEEGARPAFPSQEVRFIYPRPGTLYPADFRSPHFRWAAPTEQVASWHVTLKVQGHEEDVSTTTEKDIWRPDRAVWESLKQKSLESGRTIVARVEGLSAEPSRQVVAVGEVRFGVSEFPVAASILYRQVPLPIPGVEGHELIRWDLGDVASDNEPRTLLTGLTSCLNCHASSLDGRVVGFDINYEDFNRSRFVIAEMAETIELTWERHFSWNDGLESDENEHGHLFGANTARISPDGRYVVAGGKTDDVILAPLDLPEYSLLGDQTAGILLIYDVESGEITPLPGASDVNYNHGFPDWTPDGESVVFSRAKVDQRVVGVPDQDDITEEVLSSLGLGDVDAIDRHLGLDNVKFDLYRIPFNNGDGGVAKPIPGGAGGGWSNYSPRVSPDGKWIVYTRSRAGSFVRPDANLYVLPLEGGEPRPLATNSSRMDTWHSWSPNGKWLVFSSKRDGSFTNMYLTHIDDDGDASPAIWLADYRAPGLAVNLPEFFPVREGELLEIRLDPRLDVFEE